MALSLYTGPKRFNERPLLVLMTLNACFALAVLFAWTLVAIFVAEPVSWATWAPLSLGSQPDLLDYPFVLLWALPLAGTLGAWMAKNVHQASWAYFFVSVPIIIFGMIFTYYYFVPLEFH